jgi:hypothetical protein
MYAHICDVGYCDYQIDSHGHLSLASQLLLSVAARDRVKPVGSRNIPCLYGLVPLACFESELASEIMKPVKHPGKTPSQSL